ncbi:MAG: hypothetical protein ACREM9_05245, partial [Gemmatimonadales bacterium]
GPWRPGRALVDYGVTAVSVVVLVVSVKAVSIAPGIGAVSVVMPGLPVSVPASPAVPASPPGAPPPQAARTNAVMEPRIQVDRFM